MTAPTEERTTARTRSERKHVAILDAAESLFLAEGYERTSVDAIAASAGVSKRTIYDHFGDKERVFASVLERVTATLFGAVRQAIVEEMPEGADPARGLVAFVRRIATVTFASSEYVLYRRLLAASPPATQPARATPEPSDLLVARLAEFGASGDLDIADARRAADHLVALTFLVALDSMSDRAVPADIDEILVDGVAVFLRAYAPSAPR